MIKPSPLQSWLYDMPQEVVDFFNSVATTSSVPKRIALQASAYLEQSHLKPVLPQQHADLFAKMDFIGMPSELRHFIEVGVLDPHCQFESSSLSFGLPKHADEREMITLTWFHPDHKPDADTQFELISQHFTNKDCTSPLGTTYLEPSTLEELIDYLDAEPE